MRPDLELVSPVAHRHRITAQLAGNVGVGHLAEQPVDRWRHRLPAWLPFRERRHAQDVTTSADCQFTTPYTLWSATVKRPSGWLHALSRANWLANESSSHHRALAYRAPTRFAAPRLRCLLRLPAKVSAHTVRRSWFDPHAAACRENRTYSNVVCTVRGFSDDKRNLFEIPEIRAFCRRVVNLGFISYLDFTTTVPPRSGSADAAIGPMKRKGIPCRKSTASRTRRPRRIGSDIKMKRPGASTSCLRRSCDPLCNFGIAHQARSISLEKLLQ